MKNFFVLCLFLFIGAVNCCAQRIRECGTPSPLPSQKLFVDSVALSQNRILATLPLTIKAVIHIYHNDDGSMAACTDAQASARFQQMVDFYRPHNICFILSYILHHNNSNVNGMDADDDFSEMATYNWGGVLNINIHRSLVQGDDDLNGIAYSIVSNICSLDGPAAIANSNGNISVMPHEVGHTLGLYHTFEDFGGFENEAVARSGSCKDCDHDGDLLCDTDADPTEPDEFDIGRFTDANCIYMPTDSVLDECNQVYHPDPRNIMAYGRRSCRSYFTNGQGARMRALILQEAILNAITAPDVANVSHNLSSGSHLFLARDLVNSSNTINVSGSAKILYKARVVQFNPGVTILPGAGGYAQAIINTHCN